MRTTLTSDDNVAAKLREQVRKSGNSLKVVVKDALCVGLNASEPKKARKRFVVRARPVGLPAGMLYDNVGDLLDQLDGLLRQ